MEKRHREHIAAVEKAGITIDNIENGRGTHKKIYVTYQGRKAVLVSASGRVGRRAETNFDNQIRRFLCGRPVCE